MLILGFDIGGTKCAVIKGNVTTDKVEIIDKRIIKTDTDAEYTDVLGKLCVLADGMLDGEKPYKTGVSCGGPLDAVSGTVLCPPNLPMWKDAHVCDYLEKRFGAPCRLENDADACAYAEWKYGAGKGSRNMVFLTFGTGMGSGLILDGRLYRGTNSMAGEVGHISVSERGPVGYGKAGSFEGFCSGGGIARIAHRYFKDNLDELKDENGEISAKSIASAAKSGNETAKNVYKMCGKYLGRGLAVLVDILNPEMIVIGSVYERSGELLAESMKNELERKALSRSLSVCKIVPAMLGDSIGDIAALCASDIRG